MLYRLHQPDSPQDIPVRKTGLLSFGLGWRDKNKVWVFVRATCA